MHQFPHDFYGYHLNLLILGWIRPEKDYVSKEALVEDIEKDIEVARQSLARPTYERYRTDPYLKMFPTAYQSR
jgi:riboflavin kinase